MRLVLEELEPKLATGLTWTPGLPIDVTGISASNNIFAAGDTATLSIMGSGQDFDTWNDPVVGQSGQDQDAVSFQWTANGGTFTSSTTGTSATLQLPAGVEVDIVITLTASDSACAPGRDDPDVTVQLTIQTVWVKLSLQSSGPLPEGALSQGMAFMPVGDYNFGDQMSAGSTTPGVAGANGWFSKVLITGETTRPGPFAWRQTIDLSMCQQRANGTWDAPIRVTQDDDPDPQARTTMPANNKIYMKDAPGIPVPAPNSAFKEFRLYQNMTTWVQMGGKQVSDKLDWHAVTTITFDGTNWVGIGAQPAHAALGHAYLPQTNCATEIY